MCLIMQIYCQMTITNRYTCGSIMHILIMLIARLFSASHKLKPQAARYTDNAHSTTYGYEMLPSGYAYS